MTERPNDWDPTEPRTIQGRVDQMNQTRARCPVARSARNNGQWDLLRYEDLAATALDTARFSNAGDARYGKPLPPLELDPPLHGEYRRLLTPFFLPKRVQTLEQTVRPIAADIIDGVLAQGGGDLARELAYPLPVLGLCALLAIAPDHWLDIKIWSEDTLERDSPDPVLRALAAEGHNKIMAFAAEMIAERRARPHPLQEDVVSALIEARIGGEAMDDDVIARTLRILISAGHNSTTSAIGNTLLYLAGHPDAQAQLRAEPALIPMAIEEILRFETPVQEMPRWAVGDTEINGCPIAAGERIGMFWGAGNRDPAAFPDADQVILNRKPNRHLAFGQGIHTCLGAPMARMEVRVAVEEMLARTASFEIAGEVERPRFHRMGVSALPVKLTPAR